MDDPGEEIERAIDDVLNDGDPAAFAWLLSTALGEGWAAEFFAVLETGRTDAP